MSPRRSPQTPTFDDRLLSEFGADCIGCAFGGGAFGGVGVQKVGAAIGLIFGRQIADANADQPERPGSAGMVQQMPTGAVDTVGQLRGVGTCC